jgi:predicted CoA-binding protein
MSLPPPALSDDELRRLLTATRSIAVVGASPDPARDSHEVMGYLKRAGYRVFPINPMAAGQRIHGEPVSPSLASLADSGERIDMVDVFRRSDAVGQVVDEAIAQRQRLALKTIWLQLGVHDDAACDRAHAAGIEVVVDCCLMVVHQQLLGR